MTKKIDLRRIRRNKIYYRDMFPEHFNLSERTFDNYVKDGMNVYDIKGRPFTMGHDIIEYKKGKNNNIPCPLEEFRCSKCCKRVTTLDNKVLIKPGKLVWFKTRTKQIILVSKCAECHNEVRKLYTDNYIDKIKNSFVVVNEL